MDEGRGKKSAIQNTIFGGWHSMRRERKGENFGRSIWKAAESRCRCPRERQEVLPISNLSSPYVESERARAPGDQPPRDHSRGRLLVKACRRGCGEWGCPGCDIHFDTRLRFGTAEFHATSPKLESDSAGNETFGHARPSPSNPFLCGGPPLHPRHHPCSTPSFVKRSSHLGNVGIVQEVHQMAEGTNNATAGIGCVTAKTMSPQLLRLMIASSRHRVWK